MSKKKSEKSAGPKGFAWRDSHEIRVLNCLTGTFSYPLSEVAREQLEFWYMGVHMQASWSYALKQPSSPLSPLVIQRNTGFFDARNYAIFEGDTLICERSGRAPRNLGTVVYDKGAFWLDQGSKRSPLHFVLATLPHDAPLESIAPTGAEYTVRWLRAQLNELCGRKG